MAGGTDYGENIKDLSGEVQIITHQPAFAGPYSIIYRGKLKSNNQLVAVKAINPIRGAALRTIRRKIKREGWAWSLLDHPNILFCGFIEDDERFQPYGAFVSPWCQRGDLIKFLEDNPSAYLEDRSKIWKGVVEGVNYLHGSTPVIIHGDLKPGNCLIDDGGNARICDFGLVRVVMEEGSSGMTTTTAHTGTARYLAYELVMAEAPVPTTASDIYATGCIGLEVVFQEVPYSHRTNGNNLLWYIRSDMQEGRLPANPPVDLTPDINLTWKLVSWCWAGEPVSRPQARELWAYLEELARPIQSMAGEGEQKQVAMDSAQNIMELRNMGTPDNSAQYAQVTYASDAQPIKMMNEFGMTENSGPSAFSGAASLSPARTPQQFNISDIRTDSGTQDTIAALSQPTEAQMRVVYGGPRTQRGRWSFFQTSPQSVQAKVGIVGGQSSLPVLANHGGSQQGPSMHATSSRQLYLPPIVHTDNPTIKQRRQRQGNEVNRRLAQAFLPGWFRIDAALRLFLDITLTCPFYLDDEHEPLLGTSKAEQLLAQVRSKYPQDPRFAPFASHPVENETRESRSIFMLLTKNNRCLLCKMLNDRTGDVLVHIRSELGHRPYHCSCDRCKQRPHPRRFFSDVLLDDHLRSEAGIFFLPSLGPRGGR